MATREENIKKINDKLEQLSDEELEKVAGGIKIITMPLSPPVVINDQINGDGSSNIIVKK